MLLAGKLPARMRHSSSTAVQQCAKRCHQSTNKAQTYLWLLQMFQKHFIIAVLE
jgi:hypothetical protein